MVIHLTFDGDTDNDAMTNVAHFGSVPALVPHGTNVGPYIKSPGRVGHGYLDIDNGGAYHMGSVNAPILPTGTRQLTITAWFKLKQHIGG